MTTLSPLRYPGGKSRLAPMIVNEMRRHGLDTLVEPFAGGASVSLYAASVGIMSLAFDECPLVSAFWDAVRNDSVKLAQSYELSQECVHLELSPAPTGLGRERK